MAQTLTTRRKNFALLAATALLGLSLASPVQAQEPGGRFRVLVPTPAVEQGVRERYAKSVANETKKLIDGMVTHRSLEKKSLNELLKKFNLRERDLNCITSQQLAVQGGIELVLCATLRSEGDQVALEATFVTMDQTRFEVPPATVTEAKEAAQHIFTSFETFVNQLRLVQFCNEDLASSQWGPALEKCSEAITLNPTSESALYGKGYALMKLERDSEALEALKDLLKVNPMHSEGLQAAGFVAARIGNTEESRRYFGQYLDLNPGNAHVRLTIALDAQRAGDAEGALAIVEQGLTDDTEEVQLFEYAGYFAASAAARKAESTDNNSNDEARELYEKAVGYLGKVHEKQGAEAKAEVFSQLINALTKAGKNDQAIAIGQEIVATKGDEPGIWRAYAAALREDGRIVDAVAALDSVLAHQPDAGSIRAQQAQWLLQAERLEDAAKAFRSAVDAGEVESEAAGMNIFAYGVNEKFQKGKQAEAGPYFEAASKFVTKPYSKAMVNFFNGLVYYYRGMQVGKPETLASAQESLPLFTRARALFRESTEYGEASERNAKSLQDHISATDTYIEIQEAIIKRGR